MKGGKDKQMEGRMEPWEEGRKSQQILGHFLLFVDW